MRVSKLSLLVTFSVLAAACQSANGGTQFGSGPSSSPAPSPTAAPTRLPSFLFLSVDQARATAARARVQLSIGQFPTVNKTPGTIVAQTPRAGSIIRPGELVRLLVSVAPRCDPSYPDVCIPPFRPDLTCAQISFRNFRVVAPDDDGFDKDRDGIGCPSNHPNPPPTHH